MSQTHDDRIADEVRRRMTEIASAAGVDRGRLSVEVLFLLPPQFVRQYQWLFDQALDSPIQPQSDGGKDEGRVKAPGKPRDSMRARSMGGAKKSKRTVSGYWPVKDEEAVKIKGRLDRRLTRAVADAVSELKLIRAARYGKDTDLSSRHQTLGTRCPRCGKFLKEEWQRCPHHPESDGTKRNPIG